MNVQRILLLGSSGYVGSYFKKKIVDKNLLILTYDRLDPEMLNKIVKFDPEVIINFACSTSNADFTKSFEANLLFPIGIANALQNFDVDRKRIQWIQIASYFEMQIPQGRSDPYSFHKATFRMILQNMFVNSYEITNIFLPHIVGPFMRSNALFSRLIDAMKGEMVSIETSGEQLLPVLHIDDCVSGLFSIIGQNAGNYYLSPTWYGSILELLEEIKDLKKIMIGVKPKIRSTDWNFPKLSFSPTPNGWYPRRELVDIFDELLIGSINCTK